MFSGSKYFVFNKLVYNILRSPHSVVSNPVLTSATSFVFMFYKFVEATSLFLCFAVHRFINANTVDSVYDVLRELGSVDDLSIVLFSGSGNIDEAYILATYLQDMARGKLTIHVPIR